MHCINLRSITPSDFMGLVVRDAAIASLASASVALIEAPPGASHPRAKSIESDKLYIGVTGTLAFSVDGTRRELGPLDLLVVPKGEWFEYENATSGTATMLLVHAPAFNMESEVFDTLTSPV